MRSTTAFSPSIYVLAAVMMFVSGVTHATMVPSSMAPNPLTFATAGGVTVTLDTTDPATPHLRFEVCGSDVTQIPAGLAIVFAFDVPIHQVTVHQAYAGLALDVRVTGHVAVMSLVRDPFFRPAPWHLALVIALTAQPAAGRVAVGPAEAQAVHYHTALPTEYGLAILAGGCVDLLAADGWRWLT